MQKSLKRQNQKGGKEKGNTTDKAQKIKNKK
jgi:hypothetical protein